MYQVFVVLLKPYPLLFVAIAVALVLVWRRRGEKRRLLLLTVAIIVLTAVNMPAVAKLALGSLEWRYAPQNERPDDVDGIVVLCGYVHASNDLSGDAELGPDTLYRCMHAARLYRQGQPCPVIVSGCAGPPSFGRLRLAVTRAIGLV